MDSNKMNAASSSSKTARDKLPSQRVNASIASPSLEGWALKTQEMEHTTRQAITFSRTVHEPSLIAEIGLVSNKPGESSATGRGGHSRSSRAPGAGIEQPNSVKIAPASCAGISYEKAAWRASTKVGSRLRHVSQAELSLSSLNARVETPSGQRQRSSGRSSIGAGAARAKLDIWNSTPQKPESAEERCPCIECYLESNQAEYRAGLSTFRAQDVSGAKQRNSRGGPPSLSFAPPSLKRTSTIQSKAKTATRRTRDPAFTFSVDGLSPSTPGISLLQEQQGIEVPSPRRPEVAASPHYELSGTAIASSSGRSSSSGPRKQPAHLTFFGEIVAGPSEPLAEPSRPKSSVQRGKEPESKNQQDNVEKARGLVRTLGKTAEGESKSAKAIGKSPEPSPITGTLWTQDENQISAKSGEKRSLWNFAPAELPATPNAVEPLRKPTFLEARLRDAIATLKMDATSGSCHPKLRGLMDELELLLAEPDRLPPHLERLSELFSEMYVQHLAGCDWIELGEFDVISLISVEPISDLDDMEESYEFV